MISFLLNALMRLFPGRGNIPQMLQSLKSNPLGMIQQQGLNAPQNMSDPDSITQYLMNSGQVSQQMYNEARNIARSLGIK